MRETDTPAVCEQLCSLPSRPGTPACVPSAGASSTFSRSCWFFFRGLRRKGHRRTLWHREHREHREPGEAGETSQRASGRCYLWEYLKSRDPAGQGEGHFLVLGDPGQYPEERAYIKRLAGDWQKVLAPPAQHPSACWDPSARVYLPWAPPSRGLSLALQGPEA